MTTTRRQFLKDSLYVAALLAAPSFLSTRSIAEASGTQSRIVPPKVAGGPFKPSWESLAQYRCPEWFRDAKFGIWAHWSAQCVPEQGDWYARGMYQEGSDQYKFHCAHYGHPSQFGFKDVDHLWRAENWNPEKLIALYKAAGAKYFVALANHHDNFDTWNSKYQPWNAVNIGPKKDIVGTWAKAARYAGMRFGVTVHASHTWDWFQVAQGADKTGPYAGVPYDGNITKEEGVGKWWEGYDPQDLYAQRHPVSNGGWEMEHSNPPPTKEYCEKFFNRTVDLINQHNPDLIYFDDSGLPLHPISDVGLRIAAHYYNSNMRRHGGRLEGVLNTKNLDEQQRKCVVMDIERGRSNKVEPSPWQTDTCIGEWHYKRSLYENHAYKTPRQVVRMLVDIVSKNGNLLLNIPVRGDGTIDPDELSFVQGLTAWMKVNEESIFATRPWKISGEGPVQFRSGGFSEGGEDRMSEQDFRFVTKGQTLYATAMGWPESRKYTIRTLASGPPGIKGEITSVALLGFNGTPAWNRTADGLEVNLPENKPCDHAWVLKIEGLDLAASEPVAPASSVTVPTESAGADGSITLPAKQAYLDGNQQLQGTGADENIGWWNNPGDTASWKVQFTKAGDYAVSARIAAIDASEFIVGIDQGHSVTLASRATGDWNAFEIVSGGPLTIDAPGVYTLRVTPAEAANWHAMNLAYLKLTPIEKS